MSRYKCPCAYIYDEREGCAVFNNPPGTMFPDLPEDWTCPKCGYEKEYFRRLDQDADDQINQTESGGDMAKHDVTVFRPYSFAVGQKIFIEDGPRRGDWEVIGVSKSTVTLKCPISLKEFEWKQFCYFVEEQHGREWPQKD